MLPLDKDKDIVSQVINARQVVALINCIAVPQMIARHGYRWHNAAVNPHLTNLLRDIIIDRHIIDEKTYDKMRRYNTELKILTHIRRSNAHAVKNHRDKLARLMSKLFQQTDDKIINHVKLSVFGVAEGGPIVPETHPVRVALNKVPKGM